MQYAFASGVLILAAWKAFDLIRWSARLVKQIIKGGGGEIDV